MPPAVRALAVEEAAPDFNARFDAVSKIYRYLIVDAETCSPLDDGRVWHVRQRLDVGAMERAAVLLEGRHDFAAFQSGGATAAPTVRRVSRSALVVHPASEDGAYRHEPGARTIVYEIAGSGFLRHMVRNVVGTLVEIGHGRRPPAAMEAILESRDRSRAGRTAPASGLYLLHVEFGDSDETGKGEADEDA
jgi:tRNA pseudouridine38-40 synthase